MAQALDPSPLELSLIAYVLVKNENSIMKWHGHVSHFWTLLLTQLTKLGVPAMLTSDDVQR